MRSPVLFDKFIYLLIIANVVAMIIESHVSIRNVYGGMFSIFEAISIYIFSFEYLYRIRLAYMDNRLKGISKYIFSTYGLIDLISILPFYLNQVIRVDGRFLRILRLFRLTRIFKLGRDRSSLKLFGKALRGVKNELRFRCFLQWCW